MTEDDALLGLDRARWATFGLFVAALAVSGAGVGVETVARLVGGMAGFGAAVGLVLVWGERTRPKARAFWYFTTAGVALVVALVAFTSENLNEDGVLLVAVLLGLVVGLVSRHDLGMSPTLLLAAAVVAALMRPGTRGELQDAEAFWFALTVWVGLAAASWEHERLVAMEGASTSVPWMVMRLAFAGLFTAVVLALREDVQWGRLFLLLGVDLSGAQGQVFLVGVVLAALALAILALRRPASPEAASDAAGP